MFVSVCVYVCVNVRVCVCMYAHVNISCNFKLTLQYITCKKHKNWPRFTIPSYVKLTFIHIEKAICIENIIKYLFH